MSRGIKIASYVAGALVLLVLVAVSGIYGLSGRDFNARYDLAMVPLAPTAMLEGPALTERGEHLAFTRGCMDCHAEDGGGKEFADDPAFGVLWTSNLTAGEGGIGGTYTDEDWDRAIRHAVAPSGRPLLFMPSHEFWPLSDDDVVAMIAYFRSLEPVDRVRPPSKPGPLARLLYLTGELNLVPARHIDHTAPRPAAPEEGPTVEYGSYLATGCTGCHHASFSGGKIVGGDPLWPAAANLTPHESGIGAWTQADFVRAMREGVRPDGSQIDPVMPVQFTKMMTDTELEALYAYLVSLEPMPFESR